MSPGQLFETLISGANGRKRKSLEILNVICREQADRGSKDFSIALIGRLSTERGGPATQSIRNKTGGDFRALISAWANDAGGSVKRHSKQDESPKSSILEKIPDPGVRAVVGILLAEHKKLQGEVNLLKSQTEVVIDRRPAVHSQTAAQEVIQVLPAFSGLSVSEMEALAHAVSDKHLQDEGWNGDASGRILNEHGRVVFKAGFVSAIQKILNTLKGEPFY